jgi:hypothetical protein
MFGAQSIAAETCYPASRAFGNNRFSRGHCGSRFASRSLSTLAKQRRQAISALRPILPLTIH